VGQPPVFSPLPIRERGSAPKGVLTPQFVSHAQPARLREAGFLQIICSWFGNPLQKRVPGAGFLGAPPLFLISRGWYTHFGSQAFSARWFPMVARPLHPHQALAAGRSTHLSRAETLGVLVRRDRLLPVRTGRMGRRSVRRRCRCLSALEVRFAFFAFAKSASYISICGQRPVAFTERTDFSMHR